MRVIICGSRDYKDKEKIKEMILKELDPDRDVIISGGAPGADSIAEEIAIELGFAMEVHVAEWDKYGKGAGPIRNQKMLDRGPDRVMAFSNDFSKSKGTKNMVDKAIRAGVLVRLWDGDKAVTNCITTRLI